MRRYLGYSSAKGSSSTASSGTKPAVLQGTELGTLASLCFPHPTLSLASEQTLKDLKNPRGTNVEERIVDLAKWALLTSPKFNTGVKYKFHLGFHQIGDSEIPIITIS